MNQEKKSNENSKTKRRRISAKKVLDTDAAYRENHYGSHEPAVSSMEAIYDAYFESKICNEW